MKLVFNLLACFSIALSTAYGSQQIQFGDATLSIDGEEYYQSGGQFAIPSDDGNVIIWAPQVTEQNANIYSIAFQYKTSEESGTAELKSCVTHSFGEVSIKKSYNPETQTIAQYIQYANGLNKRVKHNSMWNTSKSACFEFGDCWAPILVVGEKKKDVIFKDWRPAHDKENNLTRIMLAWGVAGVEKAGEIEIYKFNHGETSNVDWSSTSNIFYCNDLGELKPVVERRWLCVPSNISEWAVANNVTGDKPYSTIKHGQVLATVVSTPKLQKGYWNIYAREIIPSEYIYSDGVKRYSVTCKEQVNVRSAVRTYTEGEAGGTYSFSEGNRKEKIHILNAQTYSPLVTNEESASDANLPQDFYYLVNDDRTDGVDQVWKPFPSGDLVEYSSNHKGFCSTADLAQYLATLNDNDVERFFKILMAQQYIKDFQIRIGDLKTIADKQKVSELFWKNLTKHYGVVGIDELHFKAVTLDNDILTFIAAINMGPTKVTAQKVKISGVTARDRLLALTNCKPTILDLSEYNIITDNILPLISNNSHLRELNLLGLPSNLSTAALKALANSSITTIHLSEFDISGEQISPLSIVKTANLLSKLRGLSSLKISKDLDASTKITPAKIFLESLKACILNNKDLTILDLYNLRTGSIDLEATPYLWDIFGLKNLQTLSLPGHNISNFHTKDFAKRLKELQNLTTLKIAMPYYLIGAFEYGGACLDELSKGNYFGFLFGTAMSPIAVTYCALISDIGGDSPVYRETCQYLAEIKSLRNLTMGLWGFRTTTDSYKAWTKNQFNAHRSSQSGNLQPVNITF